MASLSDRAFQYADGIRSNVTEEAFQELTSESEHNWGLIVAAFVLGAVVAAMLLVFGFRRITGNQKRLRYGHAGRAGTCTPGSAAVVGTVGWKCARGPFDRTAATCTNLELEPGRLLAVGKCLQHPVVGRNGIASCR